MDFNMCCVCTYCSYNAQAFFIEVIRIEAITTNFIQFVIKYVLFSDSKFCEIKSGSDRRFGLIPSLTLQVDKDRIDFVLYAVEYIYLSLRDMFLYCFSFKTITSL